DERLEMAGEERRPVVGEERRLRPDDLEESGDVPEGLLRADGGVRGKSPQRPGLTQEAVEDLPGRPLMGERRERSKVLDQSVGCRPRLRSKAEDPRLPLE